MNFKKICRVCLKESDRMMSIFKVNISRKIMLCASVQVWPNDGLPSQICSKCSAKLHLAFQFKKQCEKSNSQLRMYLSEKEGKQDDTASNNESFVQNNPDYLQQQYIQTETHESKINIEYQIQIPLSNYSIQNVGFNEAYSEITDTLPQPIQNTQSLAVPLENKSDDMKSKESVQNKCTICSKTFSTSAKKNRHMGIHKKKDLPYKCSVCNKEFSHRGNYKTHMRMHNNDRPFHCNICLKRFIQAQDLEKHMRTHTGERPHKCTVCRKAFSNGSNLIAHMRIHTGERPYVCAVCNKAFCQSNELTKHMRTHTGEKTHQCSICKKSFNGSSSLIVHSRTHSGERPFVCKVCGKTFVQSGCLSAHLKRYGQVQYSCKKCTLSFHSQKGLDAHMIDEEEPVKDEILDNNLITFRSEFGDLNKVSISSSSN